MCADIVKDSYDELKGYVRLIYQRGRDVPDFDLNEMFDIERVLRRRTMSDIFGHGFISAGFQIDPGLNPNEIVVRQGSALIQGEYVKNNTDITVQNLTTPSGADRTDIVYLEVREVEIDSATDTDLNIAGVGELSRRIELVFEVKVDEGSTTLPPTTGDLHDAGIHRELIGFLNRLDGVDTVGITQIQDQRRLIGFFFLNEDKNLELIGGGDGTYVSSVTGEFSFDATLTVLQPSTPGNAKIAATSFFLPNAFDVAYVILDRDAPSDYFITIQVTNSFSVPNNSNAFLIATRDSDDKIYAQDGTCWAQGQTHLWRVNPFTGQIFDADVNAAADIQGTKLLDFSVPLTKLVSIPEGVPLGGIIVWDQALPCPSGFAQVGYGSNDTVFKVAASGSGFSAVTGSNTHSPGSHSHFFSASTQVNTGFTVGFTAFCGSGGFTCSQVGHGHGPGTVNVSGNTSSANINFAHENKNVRLVLCKKT